MLTESHKKSLCIVFEKSRRTVSELQTALQDIPAPWSLTVCAGVGMLLGDLYMSVENVLRLFIEGVYKEKIAKDDSWHKRLVEAGNAKGLLPPDIEPTLSGMRRFRHRLTHGYGVEMDEALLRENIPEAIRAYEKVETHIKSLFPELNGWHAVEDSSE